MTAAERRLPLPTYEQLFRADRGPLAHVNGSPPVPPHPMHIRTGSDPVYAQHPRLLRATHSNAGFSEKSQPRPRIWKSGLPPVHGSNTVRSGSAQDSYSAMRTMRTQSSVGFVENSNVGHRPQTRRMTITPQKPARKFPPILENSRGGHYGSNGYFGGYISEAKSGCSGGDLDRGEKAGFMGGVGSTPDLTVYTASLSRNRGSYVSLGEAEKVFDATANSLQYQRQQVGHTSIRSCISRKPSISTESLPLPSPDEPGEHFTGQTPFPHLRPASASILANMAPPSAAHRIHTNGSLHQLMQTQVPQPRQASAGYRDLLPAEKVTGDSVHGDRTDSLSVSSIHSGGDSDSGKATSQNSGDSQQAEDGMLLLMDEGSFSGQQHGKSADTWKMLPEMSRVPWNEIDIDNVLQQSPRLHSLHEAKRLSPSLTPSLTQALRWPFLRICLEIGRITHSNHGRCTKRDILFAAQRILPFPLFLSAKTASLQAGAFYTSSLSQDQTKNAKSVHSGLKLDVGKIHGFMVEKKLGKFIHDLSAVYLTAIMQNLVEEVVIQCGKVILTGQTVTGAVFERIVQDGEYFGLFQQCRHLQAGRNGRNRAACPGILPARDLGVILATGFRTMEDLSVAVEKGCAVMEEARKERRVGGAMDELNIYQMHWSSDALMSLHFFLGPDATILDCADRDASTPPLIEWLRTIEACAAYRRSSMCEKDDVMETARILLPGVDYPPPLLSLNDELQYFQAISKPRLLNDFNQAGLTPLMIACMRGELHHVRALIQSSAKVNLVVPPVASPNKPSYTRIQPDTQNWTALHFAVAHGSFQAVKYLLEHGAWVEGAESPTGVLCETPLQIAAACGMEDIAGQLLVKGADPCLSTISTDVLRGNQAALVLAAGHGRKKILNCMISTISSLTSVPKSPSSDESFSLEEILQESKPKSQRAEDAARRRSLLISPTGRCSTANFSKDQIRVLQTALYHAAENGFLDIVTELAYYATPWKVYTWTRTVSLLKPCNLALVNDILSGFWTLPTEELIESPAFLATGLPVLFDLLTGCQTSRSVLLHLFRVVSNLYGSDPVPGIPLSSTVARKTHLRLNDPATADVVFRVDGVTVYAHRDVIMGSSNKFRELLMGSTDRRTPVEVFNAPLKPFLVVMEFLYEGGWQRLTVDPDDVFELMSTAHYFELPSLMRFCESVWSRSVTTEKVLFTVQHAKLFTAAELATFCDGFILQNLPELVDAQDAALFKFLFSDSAALHRLQSILHKRIIQLRRMISRATHVI